MRKLCLVLCVMLTAMGAMAQSRSSIVGTLVTASEESESGMEGVVGATIELRSLSDTTQVKHTVTALRGAWQFKSLRAGRYSLKAEFLGYKTAQREVELKRGENLELNGWEIQPDVIALADVQVEAMAVRTTINGDTLVYNASAYKVLPDADADKLLEKMPGIRVNNGEVEAHGEKVKKVLVDGREFFGEDVATAIKTIPAEAIKSIEVFDKLSDEAEFSGIDDGNSYKTINIVTHNKMKTAIFGKMSAMYATEPRSAEKWKHYGDVNGNVNFFREKSKTTVRLNANNMNGNSESQQAFGAVNYINSWGERDRTKLEGSYSLRAADNNGESWTERDYFLTQEQIDSGGDDVYQRYVSDSRSGNKQLNHNFMARFEHNISPKQRLMMRARFSISDNSNDAWSLNRYFPVNTSEQIDLTSYSNGENDNMNVSLNGNYFLRLGEKAGRTLQVSFGGHYSSGDSWSESYSEKSVEETIQQRSGADNGNYSMRVGVTYAEPLSERSQLTAGYNVDYNNSDADRLTHLYDFTTGEYAEQISPEYSNRNNTDYLTHRVGPGFRFSKDGKSVSAQINYQHVTMNSDREYPAVYVLPTKHFGNVTYSVTARLDLNARNQIHIRANSSTANPSVQQLQDVVDISNVNNVTAGNPHLKPSYTHRINLRYTRTSVEKGTTITIHANGSKNQRQIVDSVVMNTPGYEVYSPDGELLTTLSPMGRFSKPVNMSGNWRYDGGVSYAFPVKFIGCNLTVAASGSYSQSPSILNGVVNYSKYRTAAALVAVGSNFSEHVDFSVLYLANYNNVINTMLTRGDNEYIQHFLMGNARVITGFGLTLSGDCRYNYFKGLAESNKSLDRGEFLCNFAIGFKVLKKMGEVQLLANDVFNNSNGFERSWNSLYMQNSTRSVIGRYFGIRFTYNLRRYGLTRKGDVIGEDGVQRGTGAPRGGFGGSGRGSRPGTRGSGPGGPGGGGSTSFRRGM
ncbi:MAG: outer membrane beta-barrel protein [Alistipes sp.]|nr:outer membrane beta-barrel protein [Alistipes sp.]